MKKDIKAILLVSLYLVCYCAFLQFEVTRKIAYIMLGCAPVLLVWMVYTVLKKGKYEGPELGNNEFGYADKKNEELGRF